MMQWKSMVKGLRKKKGENYDDHETRQHRHKYHRASGDHLKDKSDFTTETQGAAAKKKSRFSNWDKGAEYAN